MHSSFKDRILSVTDEVFDEYVKQTEKDMSSFMVNSYIATFFIFSWVLIYSPKILTLSVSIVAVSLLFFFWFVNSVKFEHTIQEIRQLRELNRLTEEDISKTKK